MRATRQRARAAVGSLRGANLLTALVFLLALVATRVDARPSGDALMQVVTPPAKAVVYAHPHVNVIVVFGTTPEGAAPDPATFRARLNGTDVTDRFTAAGNGLRAALDAGVVRIGASNRLRLRVRSMPVTQGKRTRKLKDKARIRFTVQDRPNAAPLARASADSDFVLPGLPIRFDAGSSSDPELDALTFSWDFGDGATAEGATAEHTYASGTGDVVATVTVSDGADTSTASITLPAEPSVDPDRTKGVLQVEADAPLEFGGVPVGQQATRTLRIINTDAMPTSQLLVRAVTSGAAFTIEPATLDLGPSAEGTFTLRFAPSAEGHAETVVSLVASASNRTAVSLLGHGFGGTAPGSGPSLAARPLYYGAAHPTLPGRAVHGIRPDGARFVADNGVHACVVPGGGAGTGDACLSNADCAVHGGTCDQAASMLLAPQDLCADPEGNLVVLSFGDAVTDPNPNALTEVSAVVLRVSLDAGGTATSKKLIARVTGETSKLTCDDQPLSARGRVYVAEYFDVDDDSCDRTERDALVSIRKDGGGRTEVKRRLDSIQGIDDCNDVEDSTAALVTRGAGDPLFVSFDLGGIWRFDERAGHRAFLTDIGDGESLDVHPDGALVYAAASAVGTRTAINLYKVSPTRVASGPLSLAVLSPCATYSIPNNGGSTFIAGLAVDASAADPSTAVALVTLRGSSGTLADALAPALAPQGTVAFTVPSGSADTCAAVGLITLDTLDTLSF